MSEELKRLRNLMNLHYQTELLEAVDWDEERLRDLLSFVTDFFSLNKDSMVKLEDTHALLLEIEKSWGSSAKQVMKGIFSKEYVYLNMHLTGVEDVN